MTPSSPTPILPDDAGRLSALSEAATAGPWSAYGDRIVGADGFSPMESKITFALSPSWLDAHPDKHWGSCNESHRELEDGEGEANVEFIVALVNAYRSGKLISPPAGWVMVPIEATDAMLSAGIDADCEFEARPKGALTDHAGALWDAMLGAAPNHPAGSSPTGGVETRGALASCPSRGRLERAAELMLLAFAEGVPHWDAEKVVAYEGLHDAIAASKVATVAGAGTANTPRAGEVRQDDPACDDLEWAVARWRSEVENRPLPNVHRRALDDTWRQVIRRFGGDPDTLVGPSHDDLLNAGEHGHG